MRKIKINFRLKHDSGTSRSWKVYTTSRISSKPPKQIHIGYISEQTIPIAEEIQEKLTSKLKNKWFELYGHRDIEINWEDAKKKLSLKITEHNDTHPNRYSHKEWKRINILCTIFKLTSFKNEVIDINRICFNSGYSTKVTRKYLICLNQEGFVDLICNGYSITQNGEVYLREKFPDLL